MIIIENEELKYYDKHGTQITNGCSVRYMDGSVRSVYLASNGLLGTDATNPKWIESGRASECEYGIYPMTDSETNKVEVIRRV